MLQSLRRIVSKFYSPTPTQSIWSYSGTSSLGNSAPSDQQLLQEFGSNGIVFTACNTNAKAVSQVPLCIYQFKGAVRPKYDANRTELEDHELWHLLYEVNESINGSELWYLTSVYLDVLGRAYWLVDINPVSGLPDRLWVLMPQCVTPIRNDAGYVSGYSYKVGQNEPQVFPKERVIDFRMPLLTDPYCGGQSPLASVYSYVQLSSKFASYANSTFDNRGRPDAILSPKGDIGSEEAQRLMQKFEDKFRGGGNGRILLADTGLEYHPLNFPPTDMAPLVINRDVMAIVSNAFGIPEGLFAKDANRANAEQAARMHAEGMVLPRLRLIEQKINEQLVPLFGDAKLYVEFDSPIPPDREQLRSEEETRLRKVRLAIRSSVLTFNEIRENLGFDPMAGRDEIVAPLDYSQQPEEDADVEAEKKEEADNDDDMPSKSVDFDLLVKLNKEVTSGDLDRATAINVAAVAMDLPQAEAKRLIGHKKEEKVKAAPSPDKEDDKRRDSAPYRRLARIMRSFYGKMQTHYLSKLGDVSKSVVTKALPEQFVPLENWTEELARESRPVLEIMLEEGAGATRERIGASADVFAVNPARVEQAVEKAVLQFADSTISTTTKQLNDALAELRQQLTAGLLEGDSGAEIRKRVQEVFENASDARAELVARTEVSRATHTGQRLQAKESGIVKSLKWLASSDACPDCLELDGKEIGLDENFIDGDGSPYSDVPTPPLHPQCACSQLEVILKRERKPPKVNR